MEFVLYILLGAAFAYEIVALFTAQEGDTISEVIWYHASRRPLIPFLVGVLMGHLFWQKAS